jgi:hypothetical protein
MSTPHKAGRAKPVTLAKSASSASGKPEPVAASKSGKIEPTKPESAKVDAQKAAAANQPKAKPDAIKPAAAETDVLSAASDGSLPAAWNELVKAQSEAAIAWWQDAKDARTFADALVVNARHSRVQFEIVTGQAREMAAYFQKAFESNNERLRSLFEQPKP